MFDPDVTRTTMSRHRNRRRNGVRTAIRDAMLVGSAHHLCQFVDGAEGAVFAGTTLPPFAQRHVIHCTVTDAGHRRATPLIPPPPHELPNTTAHCPPHASSDVAHVDRMLAASQELARAFCARANSPPRMDWTTCTSTSDGAARTHQTRQESVLDGTTAHRTHGAPTRSHLARQSDAGRRVRWWDCAMHTRELMTESTTRTVRHIAHVLHDCTAAPARALVYIYTDARVDLAGALALYYLVWAKGGGLSLPAALARVPVVAMPTSHWACLLAMPRPEGEVDGVAEKDGGRGRTDRVDRQEKDTPLSRHTTQKSMKSAEDTIGGQTEEHADGCAPMYWNVTDCWMAHWMRCYPTLPARVIRLALDSAPSCRPGATPDRESGGRCERDCEYVERVLRCHARFSEPARQTKVWLHSSSSSDEGESDEESGESAAVVDVPHGNDGHTTESTPVVAQNATGDLSWGVVDDISVDVLHRTLKDHWKDALPRPGPTREEVTDVYVRYGRWSVHALCALLAQRHDNECAVKQMHTPRGPRQRVGTGSHSVSPVPITPPRAAR